VNENDLWERSLVVQERHLTLEVPTSKNGSHWEGESEAHRQNNIKAKLEQLKLSKTDPSIWS
jgi:hypothetical protein